MSSIKTSRLKHFAKGVKKLTKTEIVQAFSAALEAHDFEKAASYLSDDFVLSGPIPQPLGKQEFIAVQSAFENAFEDWSFNSHDEVEQGDKVIAAVQITGTHTRDLVLPMPGMPAIPASHKKVSLPEEHLEFTFEGDKIASLASDNVPGGGVPGVLQQIGVPLPPM
jgi:predicted ester cyclase